MVDVVLVIFIGFLGLIVGSFLNVVALRYNTGRSLQGRSGCFSCRKTLSWYELIPVFSYVMQRGRCRSCNSILSAQYPAVELLTALLFLLLHLKFFLGELSSEYLFAMTFYVTLFSLLIVILIYDIHHKIIPNGLVYAASLFALVGMCVAIIFDIPAAFSYLDLLAGPALAAPLAVFWAVSKGRWMGLGDAKLALVMGWTLGLLPGLLALLLSFWIGAVVGVLLLSLGWLAMRFERLMGKRQLSGRMAELTMKSEIPFAPFMILSLWIVFFTGMDITSLISLDLWNLLP